MPVAAGAGAGVVPTRPAASGATKAATIPILRMSSAPSGASIGAVATAPPSMFGVPALRSEDPRFLRGRGRYLENIEIPGSLHAAFVRSIMPHATIDAVDVGAASTSSGVAGVYAATDLNLAPLPASGTVEGDVDGVVEGLFSREPLARDVVRFVGEIVAVDVAEPAGQAVHAADLVEVEYEELPVVVDVEAAVAEG